MQLSRLFFHARRFFALAALAALLPSVPALAQEAPPATWRDTGITLTGAVLCASEAQPGVLFAAEDAGTFAYNWLTGTRTLLSQRAFNMCGPNGLLFAVPGRDVASPDGPTPRLNTIDGTETTVAHAPTAVAADGSMRVYALHDDGRLWASADGGTTWSQRGQGVPGRLTAVAPSAADAGAIYAVAVQHPPARPGQDMIEASYTIFFSPDAGMRWEPRFTGQISGMPAVIDQRVRLLPISGQRVPVDMLHLVIWDGSISPSSHSQHFVSADGARTFMDIGDSSGFGNSINLAHTGTNLLRYVVGRYGGGAELARLAEDRRTWQPVELPPLQDVQRYCFFPELQVATESPANLVLCSKGDSWFSPDGGASWQPLGANAGQQIVITPYLPLALLSVGPDGRLLALDLPDPGTRQTSPVVASGAPGSFFFMETGHNLGGAFRHYWQAHGGLAQFGYPRTEPFREINQTDGNVYLVQYFERARFEFHPELAGICDAVLLGLLGNQLAAGRHAADTPPFQPVADPHDPAVAYFAPTGHTLRGAFRQYWQAHGGLAIYGYPTSEEFSEVNPADGQTYLVQYFERARFEFHPEHAGTGFEVQLGLLGNELLHMKGWL
jgi:hypothetical protein